MISILIIAGVKKLVQKIHYTNKKESVLRIYSLTNSIVPEKVLYESDTNPGTYLDEETEKVYRESHGRLIGL